MLNIEKFQRNITVSITGGLKYVHEWSNEHGQGDFVHCCDLKHIDQNYYVSGDKADSINQIVLSCINSNNYSDLQERDLTVIGNRITWNQIEDGDCNEDVNGDYICDYDIYVTINGIPLEEEDLRQLLPAAE